MTAVLTGLAPDGGLYVPNVLPRFGEPPIGGAVPVSDDARAVGAWAAPALFPSADPDLIAGVARTALDFRIPLVEVLPGLYVLELFHGPTHAFKDVGARFMAGLMETFVVPSDRRHTILVATSGDTGGAVANAFHGRAGLRVVVLFPSRGVSEGQRRQMTTLGDNIQALEVSGTFDDCQAMVKAAFGDPGCRSQHALTSANSINVARLLPQSLYYVHAVRCLAAADRWWPEAAPRFVVPSGNLGNLCAGLIAARAGMPVGGFTAASNTNRPFVDFLAGESFRPRPSVRTLSNAMDVGAPSNLERIRWLYGSDDDAMRRDVNGVWVSDERTVECIRRVHEQTGYVLDPHSAVAFEAAMGHDPSAERPVVVLATAHPGKFREAVQAAIGQTISLPESLSDAMSRPECMTQIEPTVPALLEALKEQPS
jgi:threonine synthase